MSRNNQSIFQDIVLSQSFCPIFSKVIFWVVVILTFLRLCSHQSVVRRMLNCFLLRSLWGWMSFKSCFISRYLNLGCLLCTAIAKKMIFKLGFSLEGYLFTWIAVKICKNVHCHQLVKAVLCVRNHLHEKDLLDELKVENNHFRWYVSHQDKLKDDLWVL